MNAQEVIVDGARRLALQRIGAALDGLEELRTDLCRGFTPFQGSSRIADLEAQAKKVAESVVSYHLIYREFTDGLTLNENRNKALETLRSEGRWED